MVTCCGLAYDLRYRPHGLLIHQLIDTGCPHQVAGSQNRLSTSHPPGIAGLTASARRPGEIQITQAHVWLTLKRRRASTGGLMSRIWMSLALPGQPSKARTFVQYALGHWPGATLPSATH